MNFFSYLLLKKTLAIDTETHPKLKDIYLNVTPANEIPKHLLHGSKQEEFTFQHGVILKACRVIIPEKHRTQILRDLHFGNVRIVKLKVLVRNFVSWSRIDVDIENIANNYIICATSKNSQSKENFHHWD